MPSRQIRPLLQALQILLIATAVLVVGLVLVPIALLNADKWSRFFTKPEPQVAVATPTVRQTSFWTAPSLADAPAADKEKIAYGRELIAHTARYLGPRGSVKVLSNGMNCQNCHLDAGTKVFGNNYALVASTYPRFRARSGTKEHIEKRVNDCLERSLNGQALDSLSPEMVAIKAYILYLGSQVPKGEKVVGAGLKELPLLPRAADPVAGKAVYTAKCQSCHQADGQGVMAPDKQEYTFPPLWGAHSYNDAAGLFRLSNMAKFVKYNMPLGASHDQVMLTDEEAWDVAAFINSQPRPHKAVPHDWPDKSLKPFDHPFAPYADTFSEKQHKYGPFQPIIDAQKK
jgi:thiosulfate dehydrogenase